MTASNPADTLNILEDLAKIAVKKGATDYEFSHSDGDSLVVGVRNGKIEELPGDNVPDISFEIHMGKHVGTAHSASAHPDALHQALDRAISNARFASQDVTKALARPDQVLTSFRDLQLNDPYEPTLDEMVALARRTEAAALSEQGITNTEGASAQWVRSIHTYLTSNGLRGQSIKSNFSMGASVIAGTGDNMETDSAYTSARWFENLKNPEEIGKLAAQRALEMMNSRQIATMDAPVIFDRRISAGLVNAFLGAISGMSLYNKTTYLRREALGKQLFSPHIQIVENPFMLRGPASSNIDQAGLPRQPMALVENGILNTWLIGLQSGRKLKMDPNGHTGGVSNVFLAAGAQTQAEMLQEMGTGLLVTSTMGHGPNVMTGDYSAGVAGFWIENGQSAFPVSGITLAGKLKDIFANMKPANDLRLMESKISAPSIRVDGLKIGGL